MRINLSIRNKMLLYILSTFVAIFALAVGYMSFNNRIIVLDKAKMLALSVTQENALKIERVLLEDYATLHTLAETFTITKGLEEQQWKDLYVNISRDIFKKKGNFFGLSVSWEEDFYKPDSAKNNSRYYYHIERKDGEFPEYISVRDLASPFYQEAKNLNKNALIGSSKVTPEGVPYFRAYVSCPMHMDNKFSGYVVGDFSTDKFRVIVNKIKPYESTEAYLISNNGTIVSHPNAEYINDSIIQHAPHFEEQFKLSELVLKGKTEVFKGVDKDNKEILLTVVPILVGEHNAPWSLVLKIPTEVILKEANNNQTASLIVAAIGLLLLSIIIYIISSSIGTAILRTTNLLKKLSIGDTEGVESLNIDRGDEIGEMATSVNALKEGLNQTSDFAEQIGKGNLDTSFNPLSEKDKLGNSLIEMQKDLVKAKTIQEQAKIEEAKNAWASSGLAEFGNIVRLNNDDIEKLAFNVVKYLVDYLEVSIGALFVAETEGDEVVFRSKAAIAYDRKKNIEEEIRIGEGLVGRCAFEKLSIYIKDLPQDYLRITSGLGDANPDSILLVPLIFDEEVYGVVELASFNEMDEHKIAFVEKIAENIASTLSTSQNNQRTIKLLEQSKMQSEELTAQEEEMRQNMEELQATQEEAARREDEMVNVINAIEGSVFKVEYNMNGNILTANNKYSKFLQANDESLQDIDYNKEYSLLGSDNSIIDPYWSDISAGQSKTVIVNATIFSDKYTIEEHYTPITLSGENKPYKVIKVSYIVDLK